MVAWHRDRELSYTWRKVRGYFLQRCTNKTIGIAYDIDIFVTQSRKVDDACYEELAQLASKVLERTGERLINIC
jgi:hypothetical protein